MDDPEKLDENSQASQTITPPSISLPKGGGAIRGIGEKFAANPVTGTGNMSVPIATSPGRSGFGPKLSLSYDSGAGNGPFGFGWNISLPSITRETDKGLPRYQDAIEIYLLSRMKHGCSMWFSIMVSMMRIRLFLMLNLGNGRSGMTYFPRI